MHFSQRIQVPLMLFMIAIIGWPSACIASDSTANTTVTIKSATLIKGCDVDIQYPKFKGQPQAGVKQINQKMKALVDSQIAKAKKDYADNNPPNELKNMRGSLTCRYQVALQDKNLLSVNLDWQEMPIGAAHPVHWFTVFNYQLNPLRQLTLNQLFKPGSNYLAVLSSICTADLLKRVLPQGGTDSKWIKSGAKPDPAIYETFTLTSKALTIHFNEYQVACYASGPQTSSISYERIKNILSPQSAVYSLANISN
jgi:hypothetical protein